MMKGITNAEIREKFEHIESELESIKKMILTKSKPNYSPFLAIFTMIAIISTLMMVIDKNPIYLLFTIIGIANMVFFIVYRFFDRQ